MFILKRLAWLLKNKPLKMIFLTVILIVIFAVGVKSVEMATGNDTLVRSDSDVFQENLALEKEFGGESIIVVYEGDDQKTLLSLDNFKHMEGLEQLLQDNPNVYSMVSPVMLVNQMTAKQGEKYQEGLSEVIDGVNDTGGKLNEMGEQAANKSKILFEGSVQTQNGSTGMESALESQQKQQTESKELGVKLSQIGTQLKSVSTNLASMQEFSDAFTSGLPETQKTLDQLIYDEYDQMRDAFSQLILDDQYMMMSIKFKGEVSDQEKSEIVASIHSYLDNHPLESTETMLSGKPVLDGAIRSSMQESMKKMMMLAVVAMVIVLLITFKARWRLLPLGIILLAVIGTVGFMGWFNIPITMVSMAVFPILIGLGIDYTIQFQSRYAEEMEEGEEHYEK
ncbi:MMPL family transporter [Paenisporosarcina sp. TG20]|uniref:MMPL family transporter n=1 Tax=Paenisporosarcina sp. TG20 TaxID=1211706 RepID=UPI0002F0F081|nr:MMPL family transporter [Paenisporosarcina sp. TG20]